MQAVGRFKFVLLGLLTLVGVCLSNLGHATPPNLVNGSVASQGLETLELISPIAPHPLPSDPRVSITHRHYPIRGTSATELRSQLAQQGVFEPAEGRRYDAKTDWAVHWTYRTRSQSNHCTIADSGTRVEITFTYPHWNPPPGTARSLMREWQRYLAALQLHEEGHKNHGIAAARDIAQVLTQLPAAASCNQLSAKANSLAQQVIRRYNQKDIDYDRSTRHGFTQGAVFPAPTTVLR